MMDMANHGAALYHQKAPSDPIGLDALFGSTVSLLRCALSRTGRLKSDRENDRKRRFLVIRPRSARTGDKCSARPFLTRVRVTRTPAPRREGGEHGQWEGPSGAERCLDALDRDGAEPRHQQRGNFEAVSRSSTLAGSCFCPGPADEKAAP